jgi:proteasome component ECM29
VAAALPLASDTAVLRWCALLAAPFLTTSMCFLAGDRSSRQLGGLLLREIVRAAPDVFSAHAAAALPLAFVARQDEEADVAALWREVWDEATGSGAAALRLYLSEIVPRIAEGAAISAFACHQ